MLADIKTCPFLVGLTEMTRRWNLLGIIVAAMLANSPRVSACSCERSFGEPDYRHALRNVDAVFSGEVLEIQELRSLGLRLVVFNSESSWSGVKASPVFVFTGTGGGDCGYSFEVGKTYIVWAIRNESGELNTSICSFTVPLAAGGDQLAQLGKPRRPKQ